MRKIASKKQALTKQKSVTVLFSGGLDSTYLVYSLLSDPTVSSIKLMRVKIVNNTNKSIVEDMQHPKILKILKELDKNNKLNNWRGDFCSELSIDTQMHENPIAFNQVPIWILASLRTSCDEVHIGYVMNDDAISYLDDFKKIWNSYSSIHEALPKLMFPLSKISKEQIKSELPESLFQETFSCENPHVEQDSFVECGHCVSCKKNKYFGIFDSWKRNRNDGVNDGVSDGVSDGPNVGYLSKYQFSPDGEKRTINQMEICAQLDKDIENKEVISMSDEIGLELEEGDYKPEL